jgi:2,4-dienoyl-CoA reductase-like NADH-dependent reductase (Old Yellow Enzyme family)
MSHLFSPLTLRGLTLNNRVAVAPMCQYSAVDGFADDWHFVHLGRFALGGFGLVIVEATGVTAEGRITYGDLGLWKDEQVEPLKRITDFLHAQGSTAGIQLAHAGRKASTRVPFRDKLPESHDELAEIGYEKWVPLAPTDQIHAEDAGFTKPAALDLAGIEDVKNAFIAATHRALAAGFDVVEIHGAHGYLINQFLSPLANKRTDNYGGSLENRMRLLLEITEVVRAAWPEDKPLFVRISASDNHPDGWKVEDSVVLSRELKARGVDVVHCSSGGFANAVFNPHALYQVPLSQAVREGADIATMAVGLITEPLQAEAILAEGKADLVSLARAALEDPNWVVHARHVLDDNEFAYGNWPKQTGYAIRAKDRALGQRR